MKNVTMKNFTIHPIQPVLFLTFVLSVYYLYYGILRAHPADWNDRRSSFTNNSWKEDPLLQEIHSFYINSTLSTELTIITAYFDIGTFTKGKWNKYTPSLYTRWMYIFGRLNNPLILFTDSKEVFNLFTHLRAKFNKSRTHIFLIKQKELWSFSLAPQIKKVFSQPNYPKFYPNTVNENYSCVMHSKFELVNTAITKRLVKTRYSAWLDIGLFRHFTDENHIFHLDIPEHFDNSKVAYSKVREFEPSLTPADVVKHNLVWVGGAMFIGRSDVLYIYTEDYMKSVNQMLKMNIMSTDQQVIYAMYLSSFSIKPRIEFQLFTPHSGNDWFYIGTMLKDVWDKKKIRESHRLMYYNVQSL